MTRISFTRTGGKVTGFRVSGHSGFADEGEDIVCAAVTSAVRYCECMLNDVYGLNEQVIADPKGPVIELLPQSGAENIPARCALLEGLRLYLSELSAEYPNYIKILEV